MKKIITASILILLILYSTGVYAVDFLYSGVLENSGSKKYKAVKLTPAVYNSISENIADLALCDRNNDYDFKLLFNIVICIVAVALGVIILSKLKK